MNRHVEALGSVVNRPAAVGAAASRPAHANGEKDTVGTALEGISRTPRVGSFQKAMTADRSRPSGRLRWTMPKEVNVSTAEPGSSASTLAYRAAQREVSCGPSRRAVITIVGPTDLPFVERPTVVFVLADVWPSSKPGRASAHGNRAGCRATGSTSA
jgi:hypothetical protein